MAIAVRQANCSSASLSWVPPSDAVVLEYELVVRTSASDTASADGAAPIAVSGVRAAQYTVDGLDSSTDYKAHVRARTSAGWTAPSQEAVLRTGPPTRVLPAPLPPVSEQPADKPAKPADCAAVHLRLPALRRGCARDSALMLEYREAGGEEWHTYRDEAADSGDEATGGSHFGEAAESSLVVVLPREHSRTSVHFRLRARRGLIVSEPSAELAVATCEAGPVRSPRTVIIACSIALILLLVIGCVVCGRAGAPSDDFSKEAPPRKEAGMTRLKTTDEDDPLAGPDDDDERDELSVHYKLGDGPPLHGMLPLAGITDSADLLSELAEFGCELQDEVILSVSTMEVEYEDARGKTKVLGPRTPFADVIQAGEATVLTKALAQQQRRSQPMRAINGLTRTSGDRADADNGELEPGRRSGKSAVAVKVAPRPVGARALA